MDIQKIYTTLLDQLDERNGISDHRINIVSSYEWLSDAYWDGNPNHA